ncbi:hypothetical protein D0Y50_07235 [Salinimonas sediminis]|uniref:Uncharacterized protein n=1 Tax=Salinimonas sediminis TaxID=2303538 RepID=A0A346NKW8_9ALTE|nr:hypothetical protein D0Y50_07235 [Salinimonas sediminis]
MVCFVLSLANTAIGYRLVISDRATMALPGTKAESFNKNGYRGMLSVISMIMQRERSAVGCAAIVREASLRCNRWSEFFAIQRNKNDKREAYGHFHTNFHVT